MNLHEMWENAKNFFGMADAETAEANNYQDEEQVEEHPSVTNRVSNPTSQNNQPTRQSFYQRSVANQSRDYSSQHSQESNYNNRSQQYHSQTQNVVSMQQSRMNKSTASKQRSTRETHANKIIIIEPRAYSEAMKIAKHIMNGESVLVNFHQIEEYQARRIVDFLTGTVYAENGDIKRVGNEIFLCTAQGVEIDGTAQSLMDANMLEIQ
ncbi:cell division protein SepF [Enterococcus cecorum]|uniref:cell division protein SepF n=1 Tax=Enterococcus cecorum TaxID=44008 RepID=UPI00148E6C71|nr:cell division protein SepF [Enterococcus cecorum]